MPTSSAPDRAGPSRIPVARVITRLNIGGPSIQAMLLTTALEPYGYATRLIHGRLGPGEGDMSYLLPPDANAVHLPTLARPVRVVADLRTLIRLYGELRDLRPAILHTHMAKAGLLGRLAAVGYNLTRGSAPRLRIVHTYHGHVLEGYFHPVASAIFVALERLLARVSDVIVVISPAIGRQLVETYRIGRASQYRVIPLGFDLDAFAAIDAAARDAARDALEIPRGVPVIATVGRLTAIKQHDVFLDTIARLADRHPDLVAIVAGDGELRERLQTTAARRGLASRVRWLGWRRDLATVYAAADVFLLTSRNEGTPVAIIEAMASGVPAVSTDVGGVKDVIDSDAVGLLAPPGDAAALAAAAARLLADPAARGAMGERARARAVARFAMARLVDEIATLYGELAGSR